jgi:hypothetical protein
VIAALDCHGFHSIPAFSSGFFRLNPTTLRRFLCNPGWKSIFFAQVKDFRVQSWRPHPQSLHICLPIQRKAEKEICAKSSA